MEAKDYIKKINESPDKEKLINILLFEYLKRKKPPQYTYIPYEEMNDKQIKAIQDFLEKGQTNEKQYNKLALKLNKKWEQNRTHPELILGISGWLAKNQKEYNEKFYKNMKQFLFDFYPTISLMAYSKIQEFKTYEEAREFFDIPLKSYLTYISSRYSYYEEKISPYHYEPLLKEINRKLESNFKDFFEIMNVITPIAKIKILDLMIEKNEEQAMEFIITKFIKELSGKKVINHVEDIISRYYLKTDNKEELENKITDLLDSKEKPAREIAVFLIIEWNLSNGKQLLKPLLKDKNKNIVNMITTYLAD